MEQKPVYKELQISEKKRKKYYVRERYEKTELFKNIKKQKFEEK